MVGSIGLMYLKRPMYGAISKFMVTELNNWMIFPECISIDYLFIL